jgi:hypothetical protein
MSTHDLALVFERAPRSPGFRPLTGQLTDFWAPASGGGPDLLERAGAAVALAADDIRPLAYDTVERVPGDATAPAPYVRARGGLDDETGGRALEVVTDYRLRASDGVLTVLTAARNVTKAPLQVALCESGYLGNHTVWVAGRGATPLPGTYRGAWAGVEAYGAAYVAGPATGDADVDVKVVVIDEASFHSDLTLCSGREMVAPGAELVRTWLWVYSARDLAEAAATFRAARGEALATVSGKVALAAIPSPAPKPPARAPAAPAPESVGAPAPPLPEAPPPPARDVWVDLAVDDVPWARARVDANAWSARVPPGKLRATVAGDGRAPGATFARDLAAGAAVSDADLFMPSASLLSVWVVDDDSGAPVPARVLVQPAGAAGPSDASGLGVVPLLGRYDHADGAGSSVYTLTGTASVLVPPGRWRVRASRGLEYTLPESIVAVEPGASAGVLLHVARAVETPGAVACDLHLHSVRSEDSNVPLEGRVISLVAEGVEVAVATDHDAITDYAPTIERLGARALLATIVGDEITTSEPNFGHFNLFPVPTLEPGEVAEPIGSWHRSPAELFAAARAAEPGEEILQVNHPRMEPHIGYFGAFAFDPLTGGAAPGFSTDFDTIEVFNGLELAHLDKVEANLRDWYALLDLGLRKTATGNSDSHWLALHEVGYPRTYVFMDGVDGPGEVKVDDFVRALKEGRALVTNGPYLQASVGGAFPGGTARAGPDHEVRLEIEVHAAPWIDVSSLEVVVNGTVAWRANVTLTDGWVSRKVDVPIARDSWVVVLVRGKKPLDGVLPVKGVLPFAFQNPVWVDADGDGKWTAPGLR